MNPSKTMILLTHTPRPDLDCDEYDRWITDIANPFLNELVDVVHHSSWKVIVNKLGSVPYTYFDCLFVAEPDSIDRVWKSETFQAFLATWEHDWLVSRDTDGPRALHILASTEVAPPADSRRSRYVLYLPHTPRANAREEGFEDWLRTVDSPVINALPEVINYSGWRVDETRLGERSFSNYDIMYIEGPDGYEKLYGNPRMVEHEKLWIELWGTEPGREMADNFFLVVAECLTSPDLWNSEGSTLIQEGCDGGGGDGSS